MDAALLDDLAALAPVTTDAGERALHAADFWPRLVMARRRGDALPEPEAVVHPRDRDQVAAVLRWCSANGVAVVPFGAGTGVCGGAAAVAGAITLDLSAMNRIRALDEVSGTVTVEPGIIGQTLEDHLVHRGWSLGHFPSSLHCSSIGGLLAVRSAGQASTGYGKLADNVVGLEVVLADGTPVDLAAVPSSAAGPDLRHLFLGGEGTTGVITAATLRIRPVPEVTLDRGYLLPDLAAGIDAIRQLAQSGVVPAVVRLYDELDTAVVFEREPDGCLLIVGAEGTEAVAAFTADHAHALLTAAGARDLGAEPGEHWRANRHRVSYRFADYVKPGGLFGDAVALDTMEVAAVWSRLVPLYDAVRAALTAHADLVLAHISHLYPTGASIYFTFGAAAQGDEEAALRRYDGAWDDGQRAAIATGGTITHHHGVGLLRAPYLPDELGPGAWDVLRRIKHALDPDGVLNPGKLGLP